MQPTEKTTPQTILYLHSSDDLYGADIILLQIVRGLDPARFKPIVILPDDMSHVGLLSAELAASGIESMHLPIAIVRRRYLKPSGLLPFLGKLVRGTWAVRRIAREHDVRLVHGFTLAVVAAPLAAVLLNRPLVMHVHEILLRPRTLRKLLHWVGVRWADRVVCVSEATRRNVLEDQPEAATRVQTIHNGIALPPKPQRSAAQLRHELQVPLDLPLIGLIGRISPWKGQEVFLAAAAMVLEHNPACHFIVIGGVFDKETQHYDQMMRLHKQLQLEGRLTVCGFRKDARDLLSAFDVFVSASTQPDPFPTVILEAMSMGIPVIATAHGGPLEMVLDGETGLLVPPSDPPAMAAAIETMLADPERSRRMGKAGNARMLEQFEVSQYLRKVQDVYSEILFERSSLGDG